MDAKEYLGSFQPTSYPEEPTDKALFDYELEEMLRHMYVDGDVYFLGDLPSPAVVTYAREFKSGSDFVSRMIQYSAKNTTFTPNDKGQMKIGMYTIEQAPQPDTRSGWASVVQDEAALITNTGLQVSTNMLSSAIHMIATRAPVREAQRQKTVAWAVKGAIGDGRRDILPMLRETLGTVTLRHAYYENALVDFQVVAERPGKYPVPRWLQETTSKDHPLHRLCASLGEVDAYVALLEWVQRRDLTFIPVFAPSAMENGQQTADDKNLHSDLILCSLDNREIIPIQSKGISSTNNTSKYNLDKVVIVSARELGMVDVERAIVDYKGNKKTGRLVETKYGKILTDWYQAYRSGNPRLKKQLHKSLQPAFKYFDRVIPPKLLKRA